MAPAQILARRCHRFGTPEGIGSADAFSRAEIETLVTALFEDVEPDRTLRGAEVMSGALDVAERIRELGAAAGVALNPATPLSTVEHVLDLVDLVLVMTVQPGFGGQPFRRDMLPKLREIDGWRKTRGLKFRLEVDGGVDLATAVECRAAGADTFVAGTSFFKAADKAAFAANMAKL